jgi:hypothetical protein
MRKALLILCAILLLSGIAQGGVTAVYSGISSIFSGQSSGISMTIVNGVTSAGDTTVASVGTSETLRLMRIDFKPDADMTDVINIQVGATNTYSIKNALADNVYGQNLIPNFYQGALGDDLIINTSGVVRYNAAYRVD